MTWDELEIGIMYQLRCPHPDWNGVIFRYCGTEYQEYQIDVVYSNNLDIHAEITNGFHTVGFGSMIGIDSTFRYIGSKEESPEYFL